MSARSVAVVDYGAGNLKSVETALCYLGASFAIEKDPNALGHADRLIIPGVGEAQAAMKVLDHTGLGDAIREFRVSGKPLLGICLGCQVIFETSEEGGTKCLGLLPGKVRRFPDEIGLKVPHMGWNQVIPSSEHPLYARIPRGSSFYFVHSYYPEPSQDDVLVCETEYGIRFASGVGQDNLVAFQFHPEKSGAKGLRLLANFLNWNP